MFLSRFNLDVFVFSSFLNQNITFQHLKHCFPGFTHTRVKIPNHGVSLGTVDWWICSKFKMEMLFSEPKLIYAAACNHSNTCLCKIPCVQLHFNSSLTVSIFIGFVFLLVVSCLVIMILNCKQFPWLLSQLQNLNLIPAYIYWPVLFPSASCPFLLSNQKKLKGPKFIQLPVCLS